jgi:hypothetical protein
MKGTFFSSDFVKDSNGDLRLLEINTDTSAHNGVLNSIFNYTDFIQILSDNNINHVVFLYKIGIQSDIVDHLVDVLTNSATFVTTIEKIVIPGDSIFPQSPEDSNNKFILRFAYDETAILDSEYAKGTLGLLKLFADNDDTQSIVKFYHSSSRYGEYNTLETTTLNPSNLPDMVVKPVFVDHKSFPFYKIGKSELPISERYSNFLTEIANQDNIVQQYHVNSDQIINNNISSIRSFKIVYGSNLDLCDVGEYEVESVFTIPSSINFSDSEIANKIDVKHYYEFATNRIKNEKHGLLGDEPIVNANGDEIPISTMVEGDTYPSFYVNGSPNTDDDDLLDLWSYSGNTLPEGSSGSTSVLVYLFEWEPYANEITKISFPNDEFIKIGGGTRLLVYNSISDSIMYVHCNKLNTNYSVFDATGNLIPIVGIDIEILETTEKIYSPNMEDVDTFLVGGSKIIRLVAHNIIRGSGCFVAGTKITLEGGTTKNIEEIVEGDEVLSYNESTLTVEPKKVVGTKKPIHNDIVKYHFSNDTELTCTFDHPIYVNGLELSSFIPEWTNQRYSLNKNVNKIKVGDMVRLATGGHTAIKEIEVLKSEDTQTYIISVGDNHNFYANNILVHNK